MSYKPDWSWKPPAGLEDKWTTTKQLKRQAKSRKRNKYKKHYRPDQQYIEEQLDRELLSTSPI